MCVLVSTKLNTERGEWFLKAWRRGLRHLCREEVAGRAPSMSLCFLLCLLSGPSMTELAQRPGSRKDHWFDSQNRDVSGTCTNSSQWTRVQTKISKYWKQSKCSLLDRKQNGKMREHTERVHRSHLSNAAWTGKKCLTAMVKPNKNLFADGNINHLRAQNKKGKHFLRVCLIYPKS